MNALIKKTEELNIKNEIIKRISNLNYELKIKIKKNDNLSENNIDITRELLRCIRKEKNDMIIYINKHNNLEKEEKCRLEEMIEEKFKYMNMLYGGKDYE